METRRNSKEEYSQRVPTKGQQALRRVLLDAKAENQELAAENAALREQMASKELSWEEDKKKLLDEKESLVSTLFMARNDLDSLVKTVESARASQKQSDARCKAMEKKMVEKNIEVRSLQCSLHFHVREKNMVENSLMAERNQCNRLKLSFDKTVVQLNAEWESRWIVRQEEVVAELNALQQHYDKKVSQIIQQKDEVITSVREDMMALVEENLAKLRAIDTEIHQSEKEWQVKLKALEDRLRCELAAKEESLQKIQDLQKQSREMEEKWLAKEEEWLAKEEEQLNKEEEQLNKASKMEEEMKLLILQNVELQEFALKTDKQKAKMRKEEKKAKERKKEEERVKKEKAENEKKEKERLKRENKENKEREKKEKKERKKREKREKKAMGEIKE